MSSSDEDFDIEAAANEAILSVIPEKSKKLYEKSYSDFLSWKNKKNVKMTDEKVILAYFNMQSKTLKSSTLWSLYSKLRNTIYLNENIEIRNYAKLIAFLKRKNVGHIPKKSKILTKSEMDRFILNADDGIYLMMKVITIFS